MAARFGPVRTFAILVRMAGVAAKRVERQALGKVHLAPQLGSVLDPQVGIVWVDLCDLIMDALPGMWGDQADGKAPDATAYGVVVKLPGPAPFPHLLAHPFSLEGELALEVHDEGAHVVADNQVRAIMVVAGLFDLDNRVVLERIMLGMRLEEQRHVVIYRVPFDLVAGSDVAQAMSEGFIPLYLRLLYSRY